MNPDQILSILMLLQAFGVSQPVIDQVRFDITPVVQAPVSPVSIPDPVSTTPPIPTPTQVYTQPMTPSLTLTANPPTGLASFTLSSGSEGLIITDIDVLVPDGDLKNLRLSVGSDTLWTPKNQAVSGLNGFEGILYLQGNTSTKIDVYADGDSVPVSVSAYGHGELDGITVSVPLQLIN